LAAVWVATLETFGAEMSGVMTVGSRECHLVVGMVVKMVLKKVVMLVGC